MMHKTQVIAVCLIVAVWFCIVGVTPVVPMLENVAEAQTVQARKKYYDVSRLSVGAGTQQRPFTSWDRQMNKLSAAEKEGLTFYFPAGWYTAGEKVTLRRGWQIRGDGMAGTIIVDPKGQGVFYAAGPANVSTGAYIRIADLRISNGNLTPSATGAAIEIFALTHVELQRVNMDGWKYGCILDQAELTYLDGCHFELTGSGKLPKMVGLWIVNGPDRNNEAVAGSSNVIRLRDCHFNGSATDQTYVVDDGGTQHTIITSHFSGGGTAIVMAGVIVGTIQGCYFEGQDQRSILFDSLSFEKRTEGVGQSGAILVAANNFSQKAPAIRVSSAGFLTFMGNGFGGVGKPAQIVGCNNSSSLVSINDLSAPNVPVKDIP